MATIPARLRDELSGTPQGRAWLAGLPALVESLEQDWAVSAGAPYTSGLGAWTAPATAQDGTPVVLKVSWPHREAAGEARGLEHWDGRGAVRLLRSDERRWALLLERCEPGTALAGSGLPPEAQLEVGAELLVALWSRPPGDEPGLERVGDVTAEWAELVRERHARLARPFDAQLVAAAADLLESLPGTASRRVVVHGDFNPGNVLAARRSPWLAIDPKPMVGDPAYDPWPLLAQVEPQGVQAAHVRRVADLVGEPPERLASWSLARCVEAALWEADRGRFEDAGARMEQAAAIAWPGG